MRLAFFLPGILLLGLVAACSPEKGIVTADGRMLTAAERDREANIRVKMFLVANPTGDAEAYRRQLVAESRGHFIEETALLREARKHRLEVTEAEQDEYLQPFAAVLEKLDGGERRLVRDIARRELLCARMREKIKEEIQIAVSPEEIREHAERLRRYNEIAMATNRLVYARATNVWEELRGGADFAAAAKRWSEDTDTESCSWGTFPLSSMDEEPALRAAVGQLKPGAFTPPVEGDNGLLIVRLRAIESGANPPLYDLERIFFQLAEEVHLSDLEVMDLIRERKKDDALQTALNLIRSKTSVK